ncbi:hypothetical protein QU96_2716 [Acinetobacter baumannii]|nr:hypothetical protein BJAB0715_00999 [Acinetobacter baumannii BJAB0715]KJG91883.1 hypothetical protein QU96_2716 [Acinetobacter baumannii]OQY63685.1 hypothetical protein AB1845_0979 [Acinetobacter baumannii]
MTGLSFLLTKMIEEMYLSVDEKSLRSVKVAAILFPDFLK